MHVCLLSTLLWYGGLLGVFAPGREYRNFIGLHGFASLTYADGRLYAATRENGTFVFVAQPALPQVARNVIADDRSIFNASPAIVDGHLFLRSDKYLYSIGH